MKKLFFAVLFAVASIFTLPAMAVADGLINADFQTVHYVLYEKLTVNDDTATPGNDRPDKPAVMLTDYNNCSNSCHAPGNDRPDKPAVMSVIAVDPFAYRQNRPPDILTI